MVGLFSKRLTFPVGRSISAEFKPYKE